MYAGAHECAPFNNLPNKRRVAIHGDQKSNTSGKSSSIRLPTCNSKTHKKNKVIANIADNLFRIYQKTIPSYIS